LNGDIIILNLNELLRNIVVVVIVVNKLILKL